MPLRSLRPKPRDLALLMIGASVGASLAWLPSEAHAQGFGVAASGATTGAASVAVANSGNIAGISKWLTDLLHIGWGGGPEKHPPLWVLITVPVVAGIGLTSLFCLAAGVDLTHIPSLVETFLVGLFTGGGGAGVLTATHNQAQTGNPSLQIPSSSLAPVAPTPDPTPPTPLQPDLSGATQVPLTTPPNPFPGPVVQTVPLTLPTSPRDQIIAAAESRLGMPYQLDPPPDGISTIDCSLFVLKSYEDAGVPFSGVRTAEQIRQVCSPIPFASVLPGDPLFFEATYEDTTDTPGPDGKIATHIGLSYGAGTLRMIDAHGVGAQQTNIGAQYWQDHLLGAGRAPGLAGVAPVDAPTTTVPAIDTSSFQPQDLSGLIAISGARSVWVKLYQQIENIGGRTVGADWSRAQIASAQANGCSAVGWIWGYASRDPAASVQDGVTLARSCGLALPYMGIDIETYSDGSIPDGDWIRAAIAECARQSTVPVIYWSEEMWRRAGSPQLPGVLTWVASYDGRPVLDVTPFGAMRVVGKQWTDRAPDGSGLDRDVFLAEVIS